MEENIVLQYMDGPTTIIFCDDKCVSKEEVPGILKEIARKAKPYLIKQSKKNTV